MSESTTEPAPGRTGTAAYLRGAAPPVAGGDTPAGRASGAGMPDAAAPDADGPATSGAAPAADAATAPSAAAFPATALTDPAPSATAPPPAAAGGRRLATTAEVEEAMKDVVDPELGINVVDLGLLYGVHVDDDRVATLDMTLTSAACPLTDVIEDQTRQALTTGPGGGLVEDVRINWVWLPPWGPDKITDEGRDQLRALGFNV